MCEGYYGYMKSYGFNFSPVLPNARARVSPHKRVVLISPTYTVEFTSKRPFRYVFRVN